MFKKENRNLYDWIFVILGTFISSLAVVVFFDANNLILGGVSGISIILKKIGLFLFDKEFSLSIISFCINIPLLIIAYIVMGKNFLGKTFVSSILFSVFIELISNFSVYKGEMMLSAIYGGALLGFGSGLILIGKATSGGSDLLAAIIYKFNKHIPISKILFIIDAIIIAMGLFVFGVENSMYSIISIFICTKVTGALIDGIGFAKAVFIISDKYEEISYDIINKLERGVTVLKGKGMYTNTEKNVILCVFSQKEISNMKEIVNNIDNNAFIMITDIKEVLGEGFISYDI